MLSPVDLAIQAAQYVALATRAGDIFCTPAEARELHRHAYELADSLHYQTDRDFWQQRALYHRSRIVEPLEVAHADAH